MSFETGSPLVQRLIEGDVSAFDELVRVHSPRLVYYLIQLVRVREVAEDLAQEALARLWQRRRMLDPQRSVLSYLYMTARNLAFHELRKFKTRQRFRAVEMHRDNASQLTPLRLLEDREAMKAMQRALEQMPERRREAFILVRVQMLSLKEAAEVMGTAPQTITNQVGAALADLQRSMKDYME